MNRNLILTAIPFAVLSDVALMVKAFTGYSDNTLTVLGIASAVVVVLLVLKAFGKLTMPTFNWGSTPAPVQEVHNHYHYNRCEDRGECDECGYCDCDCEDEDERYTEEDLQEARDEADADGYRRGYDEGHENGYEAGYQARKDEEVSEAEELARLIAKALKLEQEKPVSPLSTVDAPAGSASTAPTAQA